MFAQYGVPYQAIEITGYRRAHQAFMRENFGTAGVPVTVIDNEFVIGFDAARLKWLLCLR